MNEIKITFGQSKSPKFNAAIKLARTLSEYDLSGKTHSVTIPADKIDTEWPTADKLLSIVGAWKTTKLIIDGTEITIKNCLPLKCYADYCQAIIQSIHCMRTKELAGWSCKHLLEIERHSCLSSYPWDNRLWWFQVGRFISKNIWQIDKEQIAVILKREVTKKHLELCPNFSWDKVQIHIDNLPATIDVEKNSLWEINWFKEPGFEPRAIGVKPIEEESEIPLEYNED